MKNKSLRLSILPFTISILVSQLSFAQLKTVQFEQLDSLQVTAGRPVVVFLHTAWCKYCDIMKNTTLKNKEVTALLNQSFYFISLDVEEKRDISFRGHTFKYKPTGPIAGVHQLAEQLGTINGELAYPALCFLNADYEILYQQEGFINATEISAIIKKLSELFF